MTKPKKPKGLVFCDKCGSQTTSPCKMEFGGGRAVYCQACAHEALKRMSGR